MYITSEVRKKINTSISSLPKNTIISFSNMTYSDVLHNWPKFKIS